MPVNIPTTNKPRIVVIGGGFGGLQVVRNLKKLSIREVSTCSRRGMPGFGNLKALFAPGRATPLEHPPCLQPGQPGNVPDVPLLLVCHHAESKG